MGASRSGVIGACVVSLVVASPCFAQPQRPAGTVTRPVSGVQHPELDKAWDTYDAVVTKSGDGIRAAISKQFDAATEKGDLDAAEKWQATMDAFENKGMLPVHSELKSAMDEFVTDLAMAKEELVAAYGAVVIALTKDKNLADARAVREEASELSKRKVEQKPKAKGPQSRVTTFDLSKPAALKLFQGGGPVKPNAAGLEFSGTGGLAWADSIARFTLPLTVTFVVAAFPDKTFDICPGIFSSPGADSFATTGIHLHWGHNWNDKTTLHIFGKRVAIQHRPIVAGQFNTIVMAVDKDRKLTITLNSLVIHQEVLPDHLVLEGCVRCGGGIGHVLYRSVTVETEAD